VILNARGPGDHVPMIARKIRTIKERVRESLISLPFGNIPEIMLIQSVVSSVLWLNFFCPKGGVSVHVSPQTIITGLTPDAIKHCCIPFQGHTQVHVESILSNDVMVSRTVGAISLGPTGNMQGTYKFLILLTKQTIQEQYFMLLPMPSEKMLLVSNLIPEGRGGWHLSNENHDDDNEDDGNQCVNGGLQADNKLDLLDNAGFEPGYLKHLQADNIVHQ
jgi:hypothetical protein